MTHTVVDGIHEGRLVTINPRDKPKGFSYVTDDAGQAFYVRTRYLEELPEAKPKRKAKKAKPAAEAPGAE